MNYNAASMNKTQRMLGNCGTEWKVEAPAYKLYNLSYEEVLVIEPNFPVTAAEYAGVEVSG